MVKGLVEIYAPCLTSRVAILSSGSKVVAILIEEVTTAMMNVLTAKASKISPSKVVKSAA